MSFTRFLSPPVSKSWTCLRLGKESQAEGWAVGGGVDWGGRARQRGGLWEVV